MVNIELLSKDKKLLIKPLKEISKNPEKDNNMDARNYYLILFILVATGISLSEAIHCYECDSSNDFSCTEFWDPKLPVTEQYYNNCSHVYDAKYCVKVMLCLKKDKPFSFSVI